MNSSQKSEEKLPSIESQTLAKIDDIVKRNYMRNLSYLPILPLPSELSKRTAGNSSCIFPIKRIVYDREENNLQKLMNIYVGAAAIGASLIIIIHHPKIGKDVEIYLGVCDEDSRDLAYIKARMFYNNFMGNFPGCQTGRDENPFLTPDEVDRLMNDCLTKNYRAISSISGVASLREGNKFDNAAFFQGIEKLIDGMEDQVYSAVILANGISNEKITDMQAEYENLYRMISPHSKRTLSLSRSAAESLSKTLSNSTSKTLSHTKSTTLSVGETHSKSHTQGEHKGEGNALGVNAGVNVGGNAGIDLGVVNFGINAGTHAGVSYTHSEFRGDNWSDTTSDCSTENKANGEADTEGKTVTVATADGKSLSITLGQSQQLTFENKTVQVLLSIIDEKIRRFHMGLEHGMFATAAYFISGDEQNVKSAASIYKSLIIGDKSQIESSVINSWQINRDTIKVDTPKLDTLKSYLKIFCHPRFSLYNEENVTPATIVTAGELAIHMGLPKKSVTGIPVRSSVSFGRSIHHVSDILKTNATSVPIGSIFHLGKKGKLDINLDAESLSMHTLLCGTTGVGKSTSVYTILSRLPEDVQFLVIEPAKGEYKNFLADRAKVYGTNPYLMPLLRLNPFKFCQTGSQVHILEHLERLASIFNVCWPMEAAMPSVLRRAMERAYIAAGWDLKHSKNSCADNLFPTVEDVMHEVENVLKESAYSAENKGNYIGALSERLRDLTVGINGMIFCNDDLSDAELFDKNVIMDLSRIGNTETKALIMGLLIIRLQEYRQCQTKCENNSLRHVTVLEEAHHLLRQTNNVFGSNLMGRSVEMLSNALAEMRSYGEGFFIVDQSPEQLDKSVIRNTNTKIIMRLPEDSDRQLVGKSIGLSEEQISELSKLPTGVAAICQNDWQESVLVKISPEELNDIELNYTPDEKIFENKVADVLNTIWMFFQDDNFYRRLNELGKNAIAVLQIPTVLKRALLEYYNKPSARTLYRIAYEFFHAEDAINNAIIHGAELNSVSEFQRFVVQGLKPFPKVLKRPDEFFVTLVFEYHRRNGKLEKIIKGINNFKED